MVTLMPGSSSRMVGRLVVLTVELEEELAELSGGVVVGEGGV